MQAIFSGIPGYMNMDLAEWHHGFAARPNYLGQKRSYICEIKVCPSDVKRMCDEARDLAINAPKFKLLGGNCSTIACGILNAGNAGPEKGILGLDNPQALQRQTKSKACYYGYTPVEASFHLLSQRYKFNVIVVKDPNQDHPPKR